MVFNGSELAKQYGAKGLLERCKPENALQQEINSSREKVQESLPNLKKSSTSRTSLPSKPEPALEQRTLLELLTEPKEFTDLVVSPKKKKRKKRKSQ